jgi:elongation factor 1-alpha
MIKGSGVDGTTVKVGYETMAHILHLKQHVMVENIELLDDASMGNCSLDAGGEVVVRPGNRAKITFRFLKRQEFIRPGMRMLFRDGHVRGVGIITRTRNEIENDNDIVNLMQRL